MRIWSLCIGVSSLCKSPSLSICRHVQDVCALPIIVCPHRFTTGYGDIIPVNRDEQMVAAAVILLGTMCFAYLIGAVGSLVAEGDRARSIRETKYEEAQVF